jgi:hypothetical protein
MLPTDPQDWLIVLGILAFGAAMILLACFCASLGNPRSVNMRVEHLRPGDSRYGCDLVVADFPLIVGSDVQVPYTSGFTGTYKRGTLVELCR